MLQLLSSNAYTMLCIDYPLYICYFCGNAGISTTMIMNYYRYGIQGNTGVLSLYKRVNGKWQVLHMTPFAPDKEKWYTLKVHVAGRRITCYLDDQKVIVFDDGTFSHGGIGIGVLEDAQKCDYKNIVVR